MTEPTRNDPHPFRAPRRAAAIVLALLVGWSGGAVAVSFHLASVVIDADSGAVLHARFANRPVRPASLTKLMTALLVMDSAERGEVSLRDAWRVSRRAARQSPVRIGLRPGRKVKVDTLLDALLVTSANDAALVIAEGLAGDEATFVEKMNATAARVGLTRTRFVNSSGLPADGQVTTARDMALLARHLWRTHAGQRARFAKTGIHFAKRWIGTSNGLLSSYPGANGMKTGFTCRAGYNLVATATRDGRTLIGVVLGTTTTGRRNRLMRRLLDAAFERTAPIAPGLTVDALEHARGQAATFKLGRRVIARPCRIRPRGARGPSRWSIEVGVRPSKKEALALARAFIRERRGELPGARPIVMPRQIGVELQRAVVTNLSERHARATCLAFRRASGECVIFGPEAAKRALEEAERIRSLTDRSEKKAMRKPRP